MTASVQTTFAPQSRPSPHWSCLQTPPLPAMSFPIIFTTPSQAAQRLVRWPHESIPPQNLSLYTFSLRILTPCPSCSSMDVLLDLFVWINLLKLPIPEVAARTTYCLLCRWLYCILQSPKSDFCHPRTIVIALSHSRFWWFLKNRKTPALVFMEQFDVSWHMMVYYIN